ncbi:hypothetical protein F4604DRAFT_1236421 [Suillus subluteus]|nr:hypothetical protein F4604DRAFT_1236421 [Suillus subluteus]
MVWQRKNVYACTGRGLVRLKPRLLAGLGSQLERIFKEIADSGIRVIIARSSIGDLALYHFNCFNIVILKVLSKSDLCHVAHVVNATPLACIGTPTPEEAGYINIFEMTEIGEDRVTILRQLTPGEDRYQSHREDVYSDNRA